MYEKPRFFHAGDQGLVMELGDSINVELNQRVYNLQVAIEKAEIPGVFDFMPTYRSVLIYYDPSQTSAKNLEDTLIQIDKNVDQDYKEPTVLIRIPTMYGGEYGPDLEFVAHHADLTTDEVITLHSKNEYLVYMVGFSPGFPYLGGLDDKLHTPRLDTPRTEIPAGSVGIADSQTGVYPIASPGGWRLIGRTPLSLFDHKREPPTPLRSGAYVQFEPIQSEREYQKIETEVQKGIYTIATEQM